MFQHCSRASLVGLLTLLALAGASGRAGAQNSPESRFIVYADSSAVGTEAVSVVRVADGWTITSTGRVRAPLNLTIREFKVRYDSDWKPLELSIDATVNGQVLTLHTTVADTTATTTESAGARGAEPLRRTDIIDARAVLLPNPYVAPFEALAARTRTAAAGTTISLYQPGQGSFTALVGESTTERIQTVERVISARRTRLTFQAASPPPIEVEVWSDETGRLLRLRIPAQRFEVAREDMAAVSTRRLTSSRPNDVDVRIQANGFSLAGTLSRPEGQSSPLPAVILVAGTDPVDRDETVAGIPVFGQLANALAEAGFAVLRYDKRGVGQSGGRRESATLADYEEDLNAAIRMMDDRKDVDRRRMALVGHGEGGALAMMAAAKEKRIAGVALLGALATTGADQNIYQLTRTLDRSKRPEAERQATIEQQRRIQQAVITGKGWDAITLPDAVRRQADTPYFQSFLNYDPARVMRDVKQPILIVQGTLDTQVPPDSADKLEALARTRKNGAPVEVAKISDVNHLLVPATTGEVEEYPSLSNATVSDKVTSALTSWLSKTLTAR